MIRRKKSTILTDAKESSTVAELKKIVEGKGYIFLPILPRLSLVSPKIPIP